MVEPWFWKWGLNQIKIGERNSIVKNKIEKINKIKCYEAKRN